MARISLAVLLTKINTLLADNSTNDITEAEMREVLTDVRDSFAHLDVTDALNTNLATKKDLAHAQLSTNTITFNKEAFFGDMTTPLVGAIGKDVTGAKLGTKVIIIHNDGASPSFDSAYQATSLSQAYVNGVPNFIECVFVRTNLILYTIYQ
ncbi:MAG: hypothetical protein JNK73_13245 [Bacteroidia bacterium]|nr:hypothetical protein [Bacteroidia bacterium]